MHRIKQIYVVPLVLLACAMQLINIPTALAQNSSTIAAARVTVGARDQLHSGQHFGLEPAGLLDKVDAEVKRLRGQLVKLHLVAMDDATVAAAQTEILERYRDSLPAVTCVVGKLADAQAKLGIDAVVALPEATLPSGQEPSRAQVVNDAWGRILKPGTRVYISGQAEKGSDVREATRLTLQSLLRTLEWLESSLDDVVQVKAFLAPIASAEEVRSEFEKFVGGRAIPLLLVEWNSTLPIEIELIAAAKSPAAGAQAVEYLTPPGMSASPVYCRIAKVNAKETIYIGGLFSTSSGPAEKEVADIFDTLKSTLDQAGSDLKHLVKATYYVASEEASAQLNALRPKYYDAARPPAASKAMVAGVGRPGRNLTIDMIAVGSAK